MMDKFSNNAFIFLLHVDCLKFEDGEMIFFFLVLIYILFYEHLVNYD